MPFSPSSPLLLCIFLPACQLSIHDYFLLLFLRLVFFLSVVFTVSLKFYFDSGVFSVRHIFSVSMVDIIACVCPPWDCHPLHRWSPFVGPFSALPSTTAPTYRTNSKQSRRDHATQNMKNENSTHFPFASVRARQMNLHLIITLRAHTSRLRSVNTNDESMKAST